MPTTVRGSAPPTWRASPGPRCPSTPPSSATTAWGATAPSRTWGHAACPLGYEPCPCSTTTRSKRSSRRTSRTWSWRSAAAHKHKNLSRIGPEQTGLKERRTSEPRQRDTGRRWREEREMNRWLYDHRHFYPLRFVLHLLPPSRRHSGSLSGTKNSSPSSSSRTRKKESWWHFQKKRKDKR